MLQQSSATFLLTGQQRSQAAAHPHPKVSNLHCTFKTAHSSDTAWATLECTIKHAPMKRSLGSGHRACKPNDIASTLTPPVALLPKFSAASRFQNLRHILVQPQELSISFNKITSLSSCNNDLVWSLFIHPHFSNLRTILAM